MDRQQHTYDEIAVGESRSSVEVRLSKLERVNDEDDRQLVGLGHAVSSAGWYCGVYIQVIL